MSTLQAVAVGVVMATGLMLAQVVPAHGNPDSDCAPRACTPAEQLWIDAPEVAIELGMEPVR